MTKKIALIDGYGFVFRAFHSLPPLTRSDKTPVGAVYGFTNMLIKLIASLNVSHLAVVFDAGSKTFRNEIYPEYKANRPPCPEELIPQFPIVRQAALSLNIPIFEKVGFEADDIIATLAKKYAKNDFDVVIVSSDKDLMQLVDDKITMYDAMKNRVIGENEVKEKFFVSPSKVLDVLSLIGDASDNVPGVKGIGVKTAAELIEQFGSLEEIFANLEQIKQKKRKEYLENGAQNAKLSKTLITLKEDVEVEKSDEDDLKVQDIDPHKLIDFLQEQGFRSLIERVKKEFGINPELPQKNEKTLSKKNDLPNFDDIKKIAGDFLKISEKITKNNIVIIDFDENEITLSTLENEVLSEVYYFEFAKSNSSDLFNFEEKKSDFTEFKKNFKEILSDESIKKIFFDVKKFMRFFDDEFFEIKSYEDVSVINHLLNSSIHNDFRALCNANFNENFESRNLNEIYEGLEKSKIPQDFDKINYYCFKNFCLLKLYKILLPKIYENQLATSYRSFELPLLGCLSKMEKFGVKVDANKLGILSKEFEQEISRLSKEIYEIAGEEFNIASPKQLGEILFEKLNLESSKKSKKTGALSTKSSVLEEMVVDGIEIAQKILDFRHYSKLKNTYTDALPKEISVKDNRIHSNFSSIKTLTGRLSSSNPNLQNIPIKSEYGKKIRECFIADDKKMLISADYSQIELRVIAHVAKIDTLIEAFKQNKDIHTITAAQVFGVSEDKVDLQMRSKAKAINFGIIYGISAFGLAKQLKIDRKEASEYIKNYLETYPGIEEYMKNCKEFAAKNGFVQTIGGRKCFIQDISARNFMVKSEAERQAINAPIQGSAADIIKKAMIKIDKLNLDAKVILQIHDELVFEVDENDVEKVSKIIKKEMESAMILDCPLKVDVAVGKFWS